MHVQVYHQLGSIKKTDSSLKEKKRLKDADFDVGMHFKSGMMAG